MLKKLVIVLVLATLFYHFGIDLLRPVIHAFYNSDEVLEEKKEENKNSKKDEKDIVETFDVENLLEKSRDKRYKDN